SAGRARIPALCPRNLIVPFDALEPLGGQGMEVEPAGDAFAGWKLEVDRDQLAVDLRGDRAERIRSPLAGFTSICPTHATSFSFPAPTATPGSIADRAAAQSGRLGS